MMVPCVVSSKSNVVIVGCFVTVEFAVGEAVSGEEVVAVVVFGVSDADVVGEDVSGELVLGKVIGVVVVSDSVVVGSIGAPVHWLILTW